MKKFSSTLRRTMERVINPPIRSSSTIDRVLARARMMTRGLATKRRKLKRNLPLQKRDRVPAG
jgi:hypothetical protein